MEPSKLSDDLDLLARSNGHLIEGLMGQRALQLAGSIGSE